MLPYLLGAKTFGTSITRNNTGDDYMIDNGILLRVARALEAIARTMTEEQTERKLIEAEKAEAKKAEAEPAGGVPILLIVEVLIALINILWRNLPLDAAGIEKVSALRRKLEPYQPVRPSVCLDGKEAE